MSGQESSRYANSLEIQSRLAHAKNYNEWLFGHAKGYIHDRVLEIGCALGSFTKKLIDREYVCVVDLEEEYVKKIRDVFKDAPNFKAIVCDIASPAILELKNHRFDTIMCFNVLEHVKDDARALEHMNQLLSARGYLCLVVPAFQSIFGEMDKTDNHYRRYSKKQLTEKVRSAGFTVAHCAYMNMPGFFGWWFNGKIVKRQLIPFSQMLAYDKIVPAVRFMESLIKPPFGQSLVLVAEKITD